MVERIVYSLSVPKIRVPAHIPWSSLLVILVDRKAKQINPLQLEGWLDRIFLTPISAFGFVLS